MDVRFPDGTVIKNVPDGTTKQQLLGKLKAKGYDVDKLTTPAPAAPPPQTFGEQVLGGAASTADIIAEGALGTAQWLSYPFRRAAGVLTGETAEDIQASQERVQNTMGAPVGRVTGASEGAAYNQNMMRQALTYIGENMDKGADVLAAETGLPKADVVNMMQSVMAAVPVKVPGGKTISKVTRGAVNKVQDIIDPRAKFYMDVAEGRGAELVAAARRPEAEIIPGVRPTFAQATADVGLPRVAAVGEQAEKIQPAAALARKDVQEAGRVAELKKIERTPEKRKLAETVREKRSEPLYGEARTAGDVVDVQPTLDYIDGLAETNPGNARLLSELRELRKGLTRRVEEDVPVLDANGDVVLNKKTGEIKTKKEVRFEPRTDAAEISSSLDGIKTALAKEDNKFIKKELTNIKDDLIEAIPSMKEAQAAFRKGSRPINQMDVGKFLREKLESPVPEGTQRAGVFAQAVRDAPQTIKKALDGQPRYEALTDVLSPAQQARVDAVLMDLSRDARVKEMAQMGREAAPKLREPAGKATLPPLLNRIATIANEIVRRLEGKVNEKLALEIASEFLDADRAAAALETAMRRSAKRNKTPKPPVSPVQRAVRRLPVITAPNQMSNEENRNRMSR
jgi:hypothetical protein